MMGYGWGMGVGGWIAMTVFWVALLVLVGWGLMRIFVSGGGRESGPRPETPAEILDRRYAAGELDTETYRTMKAELNAGRRAIER